MFEVVVMVRSVRTVMMIPSFILLLVLCFILLLPRPRLEPFAVKPADTTRSMLVRVKDFSSAAALRGALDDMVHTKRESGELLFANNRFQFPGNIADVKNLLFSYYKEGYANYESMYVDEIDVVTCSFQSVESLIVCKLRSFYEKNICSSKNTGVRTCVANDTYGTAFYPARAKCGTKDMKVKMDPSMIQPIDKKCTKQFKLQGPVYVLVFTFPYWRNSTNDVVSVQHIKSEISIGKQLPAYNTSKCTFAPNRNDNTCSSDENQPIRYYVQILYPRYNQRGTYLPHFDFMTCGNIERKLNQHFTNDSTALMNVRNPRLLHTPGGCASSEHYVKQGAGKWEVRNTDENGHVIPSYRAICMGSVRAKDDKPMVASFAVMYTVNPDNISVKDMMDRDRLSMSRNGCVLDKMIGKTYRSHGSNFKVVRKDSELIRGAYTSVLCNSQDRGEKTDKHDIFIGPHGDC